MSNIILQGLTLDQLQAFIKEAVNEAINNSETPQPTDQADKLLSVKEAGAFLGLAVPTIYSKVSRGELPVMKQGNRLYFSSTELMEYIKEGRQKTNAEIEAEAEAYLTNSKR